LSKNCRILVPKRKSKELVCALERGKKGRKKGKGTRFVRMDSKKVGKLSKALKDAKRVLSCIRGENLSNWGDRGRGG